MSSDLLPCPVYPSAFELWLKTQVAVDDGWGQVKTTTVYGRERKAKQVLVSSSSHNEMFQLDILAKPEFSYNKSLEVNCRCIIIEFNWIKYKK